MTEHCGTNFGLIYPYMQGDRATNPDPALQKYEPHWAAILDHMVWAEELGFDSIWLAEHHFEGDHAPSPQLLAAAIAMRTKHIRISSNVMLATLLHPLRLAEEAAMVQVLSNGRYDLGIGMGYFPLEFEAFGVNMKNRPSLLVDAVNIARLALTGERFSYEGKRFTVPEVSITPVPERAPKIRIGGQAEVAIQRVARIGDGFLSAHNDSIQVYVDELERLGKQGTVCAGQQSLIAEDPEREIAEHGEFALKYCNDLIDRQYFDRGYFDNLQEAVDFGAYIVWDGDTTVKEITALIERFPLIEDVHFMASSGPDEPLELTKPRIQYLADYVLPRLRENVRKLGRSPEPSSAVDG